MSKYYHPTTLEHIDTENPAPWMNVAEVEAPEYDSKTQGCFYEKGGWVVKEVQVLPGLKTAKLQELKIAFQNTRKTARCMCALGFEIDANEEANMNITGLLSVIKEGEKVMFRAYDNSFHEVSKEDLEIMRNNIIGNSIFLYEMKWSLEERINNATTKEELDAIVWNY